MNAQETQGAPSIEHQRRRCRDRGRRRFRLGGAPHVIARQFAPSAVAWLNRWRGMLTFASTLTAEANLHLSHRHIRLALALLMPECLPNGGPERQNFHLILASGRPRVCGGVRAPA